MKHFCYFVNNCFFSGGGILLLLLFLNTASAQQSNLVDNEFTPLITDDFDGVQATSEQYFALGWFDYFSNKGNLTNSSLLDYSNWEPVVSIGGNAWIEVVDNNATGSQAYPAGSYAGFVVADNGLLGLLSNLKVATYLGGTKQEEKSGGELLTALGGILGSGKARIGFETIKPFDRIRLTASVTIGVAIDVRVYYAEVKKYVAGPQLVCNTNTTLMSPAYPAIVQPDRTGFTGVSIGSITNPDRAVDNDPTNYASLNFTVAALATGSFSIQDKVTTYPAATFAGMDIDNPKLLGLDLLGSLTVTTYLSGVEKDIFSGSNLLSVPSSMLSGTGRQTVGFITTQAFDEVRLTITKAVGLDLGTTRIYGMVLKEFCSKAIPECNTLTPGTNPDYPVYINGVNTGVDIGVCAGCAINNTENVIDADEDNYASVVFAAGALTDISLSVANALDDYDANTFVGFDLGIQPLLTVDVLGSTTIELFKNGTSVQVGSGDALLAGVTSSILQGGFSQQPVGIIAKVPFDEVKITFNQTSVNLGTIRVYNALFTTTCAGTLSCNETNYLIGGKDHLPVYINSERTGTSGLVGASKIEDPWNVVDSDPNKYADVQVIAGVAGNASISVVDAINVYPAGTVAGFVVSTEQAGLLQLNLFQSLTLTTYLDGTMQESASGNDLLNLDLLGLIVITGAEFQPSFRTTLPFDEVQISFGGIAGVLNHVHVYSALADFRFVTGDGPLACYVGNFNPDFNATWINVPVVGDVSTNDQPNGSATYGTPVPSSGNPAGGSLNITGTNGTYDFTSTNPGVFRYDVPVCVDGVCTSRTLQITVLDGNSTSNPPVANPDYGSGPAGVPIVINSVANDGPGNEGIDLDTTSVTIITPPTNGTAIVNTITSEITYTPDSGFTGRDSLEYQICDKGTPANCGSAYQYFTVYPDGFVTTTDATDDFASTPYGEPVTGNVSDNDIDPQGLPQTVTAQTNTVSGVGTLTLSSTGDYTFTPEAGFSGPHDFTYTTCQTANPSVCASATLHVLAEGAVPDYQTTLSLSRTAVTSPNSDISYTIRVFENNNVAASPGSNQITVRINKDPRISITWDPNFQGPFGGNPFNTVNNNLWDFDSSHPAFYSWTYTGETGVSSIFPAFGSYRIGVTAEYVEPTEFSATTTITSTIPHNSAGGESYYNNNQDAQVFSIQTIVE